MMLAAAAAGFGRLRLGGRSDGFGWSGPAGIGLGRDRAGRGGLGRRSGLRRWRRAPSFFSSGLEASGFGSLGPLLANTEPCASEAAICRPFGAEPRRGERRRLGAGAIGAAIAAVAVIEAVDELGAADGGGAFVLEDFLHLIAPELSFLAPHSSRR